MPPSPKRLLYFIVLLIGMVATQNQVEAASDRAPNPEVDIIVSFLRLHPMRGVQDTIEEKLMVRGVDLHDLLTNHTPEVPDDLLKDFCDKNKRTHPVWPELRSRCGVLILSEKELNSFFGTGATSEGWKKYEAQYPHGGGILRLSRVGFNRQGTKAMFWYALGAGVTRGLSTIQVMDKRHGKWVPSPVIVLPPVFG